MPQNAQRKFRIRYRRSVRAQRILRLPALRQPLRDGGEQRQGGQQQGKGGEILRGKAHAPRESLAGELAVNFTVAGFAIGHHHVFPGDKVAHRQRPAAGDLLRRPQGGDSHGHHWLADYLPAALFVDRHRDINALLLQQLANLEGVGGYRLQ